MLQKFPMYSYIPVKDLARARTFYENKLGFKLREEVAGGVVYEFGEKTACFMYPTPNVAPRRRARRSGRWTISNGKSRTCKRAA